MPMRKAVFNRFLHVCGDRFFGNEKTPKKKEKKTLDSALFFFVRIAVKEMRRRLPVASFPKNNPKLHYL